MALQRLIEARSQRSLETLRPELKSSKSKAPGLSLSKRACSIALADSALFGALPSDQTLLGRDVKGLPAYHAFFSCMGDDRPSPASMQALTALCRRFVLQAAGAPWSRPYGARAIVTRRLKPKHGSSSSDSAKGFVSVNSNSARIADFLGHSLAVNQVFYDTGAPCAENALFTNGDVMNRKHMGGYLRSNCEQDMKRQVKALKPELQFLHPIIEAMRSPVGSFALRCPSLLDPNNSTKEREWIKNLHRIHDPQSLTSFPRSPRCPMPGVFSHNGISVSAQDVRVALDWIKQCCEMDRKARESAAASKGSHLQADLDHPSSSSPSPLDEEELLADQWGSLGCSLTSQNSSAMDCMAHLASASIQLTHFYETMQRLADNPSSLSSASTAAGNAPTPKFLTHLHALRDSGMKLMSRRMHAAANRKTRRLQPSAS